MQEKAGLSDGPGDVRFARCQADGKLWQREQEKRADEKPTRKKPQLSGQPKAGRSIRSKADIVLAGNGENENAANGDTALRA